MAKTKEQKKALINEYKKLIEESKAVIILKNNGGVTPNEANDFRKELFDIDSKFRVVKNTLFKIAIDDAKFEPETSLDSFSHTAVFIKEDIAAGSKALSTFVKAAKSADGKTKLEIISGYLDGAKISSEMVQELADMPDFEGSISMILGILDNALSGVVNVLEDSVRSYVTILDQAFKE